MGLKQCRPWTPTQAFLLPPSPLEWLPAGHLVYFILDVVAALDLREVEAAVEAKDPRGERPYQPAMMVALLVYGYCVGIFSSRRIARATYEDVAFRVLAAGSHPHFTTINQFRLGHRAAFMGLFVQVLRLCQKAGLVKLGHVAFDGSKVAASASKHKAMSYQRMNEQEARLAREVEALLARADAADRQDDEKYGVGCAPEDVPEELQRREERIRRIREAKAALEAEAAQARAAELRQRASEQRAKADEASVDATERKRAATRAQKAEKAASALAGSDDPPTAGASSGDGSDLPSHRVAHQTDGKPAPTAQRNFTDANSRIMVKDGAVLQGYNAQIAVDAESQVIIAEAVTNQAPDQEHLVPMVDRVEANCGRRPAVLSADNGYYSKANVEECTKRGVDAYVAIGRERDGGQASRDPVREQMRTKLRSAQGKAIYARRKTIVEPPFGQIKQARGFRRFSLRGLAKVRNEWTFVCLTHNLLKLFRTLRAAGPTPVAA